MISEAQAAELFAFFEKYAAALHGMARDEKEKLGALLSNSLPRIEHAISTAQANTKLIENYENRRIALQESLGCPDMTFTQLLEAVPDANRLPLSSLFRRIQAAVDEIKFTNEKSMEVAHTNITRLTPETLIAASPGGEGALAAVSYGAARGYQSAEAPSIFKTKV